MQAAEMYVSANQDLRVTVRTPQPVSLQADCRYILAAWVLVEASRSGTTSVTFDVCLPHESVLQVTSKFSYDDNSRSLVHGIGSQITRAKLQDTCTLSTPSTKLICFPSDDNFWDDVPKHYDIVLAVNQPSLVPCSLTIVANSGNATWSPDQTQRLLNQLCHVCEQLFEQDSPIKISKLSLLSRQDYEDILRWNSPAPALDQSCLHDLVDAQSLTQPLQTALCSQDGSLSYGELKAQSDYFSRLLYKQGLATGDVVPICATKSVWVKVAILSVLKAGGTCVLLDINHPDEHLLSIVNAVHPGMLLLSADQIQRFEMLDVCKVTLSSSLFESHGSRPDLVAPPKVPPENAAFIVFSSGSTGKPKGILLSHQAVSSSASSQASKMGLDSKSRALQFSSYAFDVSIYETFIPLTQGGCVVVPSETDRLDNLTTFIQDNEVNWAILTPSVVSTLEPDAVSNLETLNLTGECPSQPNIDTWAHRLNLINAYGSSEASTCALAPLSRDTRPNWIGRLVGVRSWIVQAENHHHLVPVGELGELVVEGYVVASGYLADEQKTRTAFVDPPGWAIKNDDHHQPQARFFKTGDLARYCPDGSLLYCGRKDTQIRLRGHRVEPEVIENMINQFLPEAENVVVVATNRPDKGSGKLLIAVISFRHEQRPGQFLPPSSEQRDRLQQLRCHLTARLPGYMIPVAFVIMREVPSTITGKIDRKILEHLIMTMSSDLYAQFSLQQDRLENREVQELTAVQTEMRDMWQSALEVSLQAVVPLDNFFLLGGDSVRVIKLISIARATGHILKYRDIFERPTLQDMACLIEADSSSHLATETPRYEAFSLIDTGLTVDGHSVIQQIAAQCDLLPAQVKDAFPCTPFQAGAWALSLKQEGTQLGQTVFKLARHVDLARFKAAWQKVVAQAQALNIRFSIINGQTLLQVVTETQPEWILAENLLAYRSNDRDQLFKLGQPSSRFALVSEDTGDRYLVWTTHHAIYDAWTLSLLEQRLHAAYLGDILEPSPPIRDLVRHIQNSDLKAAEKFWISQFEGIDASDFPSPPAVVHHDSKHERIVQRKIPFRPATSSNSTTPSMIQASWALIIARYNLSDDVLFGQVFSGRNVHVCGIDKMFGAAITTVPMRIRIDRTKRAGELVRAIQEETLSLIPHQHLGLQNIQKLNQDAQRACQFNNILIIEPIMSSTEGDDGRIQGNEHVLERIDEGEISSRAYPLHLRCSIAEDHIVLEARHDGNVISSRQVERLMFQLGHVLNQLKDPEYPLSAIEVVSPMDKQWIAKQNSVETYLGPSARVHDLISAWAMKTPNAEAICGWDQTFSYFQLDEQSSRLAAYLRSLSLQGTRIPLCFEKSAWAVVALVAVLKAGATFVPLDPSHPADRLRSICKQCSAHAILVSPSEVSRFEGSMSHVLPIDGAMMTRLREEDIGDSLSTICSPDAYVIFTSGTTGTPKGVVITHDALSSSLDWQGKMMKLDQTTRALQFASYAFDAMILETAHVLVHGGCVCIPSELRRLQLSDSINIMRVSWTALNPSVARTLRPADVPYLKTLVVGGEPIGQDVIDMWSRNVSLINIYGPTETCIFCSAVEIDPDAPDAKSIGRCINSRSWVVDPDNHERLAPVGAVGELLVDGPILAKGYLCDQEKTAKSFIKHCDWLKNGTSATVYKTGDLVQYKDDGTLTIIGRKDTQVKIRGNRLELADIESQIRRLHPQASFVALQVVDIPQAGTKQLAAFLCNGQDVSRMDEIQELYHENDQTWDRESELLDHKLRETLPGYMIPSVWVQIWKIPITSSGKLNQRLLGALAQHVIQTQSVKPRTDGDSTQTVLTKQQRIMADLWAEVLRVDVSCIATGTNFFSLGGDSIVAMLLSTLSKRAGLVLSVLDIFKNPTLAAMAHSAEGNSSKVEDVSEHLPLINAATREKLDREIIPDLGLDVDLVENVYPCTALQNALLSLSFQNPGTYVCRLGFHLPASIDLFRFREAWNRVAQQHEMLRTTFAALSEIDYCHVVTNKKIDWVVDSQTDMNDYLGRAAQDTLPLGQPMFRVAVLRDGFLLTTHHACYDSWSLSMIFHDVEMAYAGGQLGSTISMEVFVSHLKTQDGASAREYWDSQLATCPQGSFPALPDSSYMPRADSVVEESIGFAEYCSSNFTAATVIRAAWSLLLACYLDSDDVVFGVMVNGRAVTLAGIEKVAGPTIATMPCRVRFDPNQTVESFLHGLQDQAAQMSQFEQYGLRNIAKLSSGSRNACSFQNILSIVKQDTKKASLSILSSQNLVAEPAGFHTHGLNVEVTISDSSISIKAFFDSYLIDIKQVSRMIRQLECGIRHLRRSDPLTKVGDVNLTSDQDLKEMVQWNSAPLVPVEKTVHESIHAASKEFPHAPAICAWDGNLSYTELDRLSWRLALKLVPHIKRGDFVPVCFEKSLWALVSMIAVLKAGGIYVPLDPAYPTSRSQGIIDQIGAHVLICSTLTSQACSQMTIPLITVGEDSSILAAELPEEHHMLPQVAPSDLAFALFTSGSTGKPKGILIEHRGFCFSAAHHGEYYGIGQSSRVFQFAAYIFDISFGDLFTTLMRGGCVCIPSDNDRLNDLAGSMRRLNANHVFLTPTVASTLIPEDVPELKVLVVGGEAPTQEVLQRWGDSLNLIVIWGPAECTVYSTARKNTRSQDHPACIGEAMGSRIWIIDPRNHDRLAPIGTVGELCVEGPLVARGYINDEKRTKEAFITDPAWTKIQGYPESPRRFYKTADMARYLPDGSIHFVGRRDAQVKIRGQRVELPDIEYQMRTHPIVCDILALYPRAGPFSQQLVAVLSLRLGAHQEGSREELHLDATISPSQITSIVSDLRDYASIRVPSYMVPAHFIIVTRMPWMPSGKLNRAKVNEWLLHMSNAEVEYVRGHSKEHSFESPQNLEERSLVDIWSQVLDVAAEHISVDRPFVSLGGDSISAMQVVARYRAEGLKITVQDVLRMRTIRAIASYARPIQDSPLPNIDRVENAITSGSFPLSPIQQLFFEATAQKSGFRFNQSFLLSVQSIISTDELQMAMDSIVKTHPQLRARFLWDEDHDCWMQRVAEQSEGSYRIKKREVGLLGPELLETLQDAQNSLDILQGPLISAELLDVTASTPDQRDSQLLFLTCQHLVVDLVSWRIILTDLESLLKAPRSQCLPQSLPFSRWNTLRQLHCKSDRETETEYYLAGLTKADFEYWGVEHCTYGDLTSKSFQLGEDVTIALFDKCNQAFNTEPLELMLAALVYSFGLVFNDHALPTIHSESHGRHPWESSIDVSRTVGWFTSIYPVSIGRCAIQSFKEAVRRVKDAHRNISQSAKLGVGALPMEILFNYSGRYQQLERADSLFRDVRHFVPGLEASDVDPSMRSFAIFEVATAIVEGRLEWTFRFPRKISHIDCVIDWVRACETCLTSGLDELLNHEYTPTLTDYPLLSTYLELDHLLRKAVPMAGLEDIAQVEDLYPCTPLQEQMLRAHGEDRRIYTVRSVWELCFTPGHEFDPIRFEEAWLEVVRRHDILRTLFASVEDLNGRRTFYQILLRDAAPRIKWLHGDETTAIQTLLHSTSIHVQTTKCAHLWELIITPNGRVFAQLQINHALIDGISVAILHQEICRLYAGRSIESPPCRFKDLVKHLHSSPQDTEVSYWKTYLGGAQACYLGNNNSWSDNLAQRRAFRTLQVELGDQTRLVSFINHDMTPAVLFQTAWAIVLKKVTGGQKITFGYVVATRDQAIQNISSGLGPFITFLPGYVDFTDAKSSRDIMATLQTQLFESLQYQNCSLVDIHRAVGAKTPLFDSVINFQGSTMQERENKLPIRFQSVCAEDPMEVS
jgi:amino acid adenylation domain-containing protein